jgi:hypothetical protein
MTPSPPTANAVEVIHQVLAPLSRLNAWARLPYEQKLDMHEAAAAIYRYKRTVLAEAIRAGIAQLRIVAVERPCKTCDPQCPGQFKRFGYEDEYWHEDCRRCNATGRVTLRFVESNIDGFKWHTPRPKWDLSGLEDSAWENCELTEWTPEQPGAPLERIELIGLLNQIESVIFQGRTIPHFSWPRYYHQPDYSLHLGEITRCWVCGADPARTEYKWGHEIYRPGFRWKQRICEGCDVRAYSAPPAWPANLDPRWRMDERRRRGSWPAWQDCCPLPDIASGPEVTAWLSRRGIVPCCFVPGAHCCAANGTRVEVQAIRGADAVVMIDDSEDWLYASPYGENSKPTFVTVPANSLVWSEWCIKQPAAPWQWPDLNTERQQ